MIIVDTNVWSETLRPDPDPRVLDWLRRERDELFLTAVTVHELRYGAQRLPEGSRKEALIAQITRLLDGMAQRTLHYGAAAAARHANFRIASEQGGRALSGADGEILGIAAAAGAAIATRNTRDFDGFGIEIINPWQE